VDWLQRRKFPRTLAVLTVFLLTFIALGLILVLVIPMGIREIAALFAHVPQAMSWFQTHIMPWLSAHFGVQPGALQPSKLMDLMSSNFVSAGKLAGKTLATVSSSAATVFEFFINLILIPVVTFTCCVTGTPDAAHHGPGASQGRAHGHAPGARMRYDPRRLSARPVAGNGGARGFYSAVLSLIGLDNAAAIGVVAGVLSFVPYLGIITGVALALLTALLQGGSWLLLWVAVVFAVGQLLNDLVLTPRLVGERIGLHPALVIFAILVGGALFGFAGILLALPVAAAATVLIRYARERYVESRLYQGNDGGPA